jgi:saccharopine dehydrogenase-like NADP-dependent oxidoreductase
MKILLIGAGGVGNSLAKILATRSFYERVIVSDFDLARAEAVLTWIGERFPEASPRFQAEQIDASSADNVARVAKKHGATIVMNAVEPSFVESIFEGSFAAGADYMDMAMSLSHPHPDDPYNQTGIKLGDWQFERAEQWEKAGRLALVGMGVEPGISDVFARYASDHLFSDIDEIGVRDGANLVVTDDDGREIFAPSFSIWTTIEECLNPPLIYEKGRGWFTTEPFSEPEIFDFPAGIGPVECVNVEHEEVVLVPRFLDAKRVTFKYGLGDEFIGVLKTLHLLGLDKNEPITVRTAPDATGLRDLARISPRDLVASVLPDPATLGHRMSGTTCAGVWVTGKDLEGKPREVYLYHAIDNAWTMEHYDAQCVVWQTALAPAIALELLATGAWSGSGVLGPEALDAKPFLDLMALPENSGGYGQTWGLEER